MSAQVDVTDGKKMWKNLIYAHYTYNYNSVNEFT